MSTLVGIDLGTTNSAIAIIDNTGRPEIVPNGEGDHVTPSAVFYEPDSPDGVTVGQSAKDNAHVYPDRVMMGFKRDMSTNSPRLLDGREISPVELSAAVLQKLVTDAAERKGPISAAVITVPANFANEARLATIRAGKRAGLTVSHIINEPTAALFYYSYHQPVSGRVVVYDFGGGTLDVSIADVHGRHVEIVTSKGDPRLGGCDFDARLELLIHNRYEAIAGEAFDPAVHHLSKTPEEYKKQLTVRRDCSVQVVGGKAGRTVFTITREEFEEYTSTLIAKADLLLGAVLQEANVLPSEISHVFLVGGSTRMPMVAEHLELVFGKAPVCHVNPDEVVALGAALYAAFSAPPATLNQAQKTVVDSMALKEVANHFFGTICRTEGPGGRRMLHNSLIIDKNTPLPCEKTDSYYTCDDDQRSVRVTVTQSASRETDPAFVRVIWEGELGPLPPNRQSGMEIRVTFSYDSDQIMHCRFVDVGSGLSKDIELGITTGQIDDVSDATEDDDDDDSGPFRV
jgi:molecular chaperone DnaK